MKKIVYLHCIMICDYISSLGKLQTLKVKNHFLFQSISLSRLDVICHSIVEVLSVNVIHELLKIVFHFNCCVSRINLIVIIAYHYNYVVVVFLFPSVIDIS